MNFSALNTHAIGVISASASVGVLIGGAGTFSASADVSAQALLTSHTSATVVNAAGVVTIQSVIRFANATAAMGCNAAANTEGYRVRFSYAELVCTASSNANAVVQHQAVVSITAQATNVAVGSRVAYTSASLEAVCDLTANSGVVTLGISVEVDATALVSAEALTIRNAQTLINASALVDTDALNAANAAASANASASLSASPVIQPLALFDVTSVGSVTSIATVTAVSNAMAIGVATSSTTAPAIYRYVVAEVVGIGSVDASIGVVASASGVASAAANITIAAIATHRSIFTIEAAADVSAVANVPRDLSFSLAASCELTSTSIVYNSATSAIVASCAVTATPTLAKHVSALIAGNAVHISIGHKIAVYTDTLTTATSQVAANAANLTSASAQATAVANITAGGGLVIEATAPINLGYYEDQLLWDVIPGSYYGLATSYFTNLSGDKVWKVGQYASFAGISPTGFAHGSATGDGVYASYWDTYRIGSSRRPGSTYINTVSFTETYYYYSGYYDVTFDLDLYELEQSSIQSVWVDTPVPSAEVVVSEVAILTGNLAYPMGSAEVSAQADIFKIGEAVVTGSAVVESQADVLQLANGTGSFTATCTLSATAFFTVPVTADVLDSGYWIPEYNDPEGYWTNDVYDWVYQVGLEVDRTSSSPTSSIFSGSQYTYSPYRQDPGSYFGTMESGQGTLYRWHVDKYEIVNASYWVPPVVWPAVWVETGYTPQANVTADAEVTTTSTAAVMASSELGGESFVVVSVNAQATSTAEIDSVANVIHHVFCLADVVASSEVTAGAGIQFTRTAAVTASASGVATGHLVVYALADVLDSGYWLDGYNTTTVTEEAIGSYFDYATGGDTKILTLYESGTGYSAGVTYSEYAPSIVANMEAATGFDYDSYLSHSGNHEGSSGYFGYFKKITTTIVWTDPEWIVTGYTPQANIAANALILKSVWLTATANCAVIPYAEVFVEGAITSSAAIDNSPGIYIDVSGAFAGSSASVSEGQIVTSVIFSAGAGSTVTADVDRTAVANGVIEGTASVEANGAQTVQSIASIVTLVTFTENAVFNQRVASVILNPLANFTVSHPVVIQEGFRSNGILILVAAEDRAIVVDADDRTILVDAENRTIVVEFSERLIAAA